MTFLRKLHPVFQFILIALLLVLYIYVCVHFKVDPLAAFLILIVAMALGASILTHIENTLKYNLEDVEEEALARVEKYSTEDAKRAIAKLRAAASMVKKLPLLVLILSLCGFAQTANYVTSNLGASGANCSTTAPFNCLVFQLPPGTQSVGINLSGTWVATSQFEGTTNNGTTWVAAAGFPIPNGLAVTSSTANGTWVISVSGFTHVRVRNSAFTSGSVVAEMSASFATNLGEALDNSGRVITTTTAGVPTNNAEQQGTTLLNGAPTVSGANATATVTLTGAAGFRVCVRLIAVKATGAAATSTLTVQDGATVVLDFGSITAALNGPSINFPGPLIMCGSSGNNVVVNIGAGGVGAITTTSVIADRQ